ncbi:hypothetical protein GGR88_001982 [Sphingomonas jejuensis]|uniref:Uncharacterized protein n=1 Tax=Sphingomonas jejuensis TaxID=904715 RepID=A0ABX0XM63_9SPHN|nr:hypothetical protein [Sphingomonas jejuensis]NJC34468.1 hypothetical protein [Sphingomonas jejuensis]
MLAIMMLASMGRCAAADLCPTDQELIAAVMSRDAESASAASDQAAAAGEIVMVHPERVRRITDVICSDALPGNVPMITCRMTVRYWSTEAFQVAKLRRDGNMWSIAEALAVVRDRR